MSEAALPVGVGCWTPSGANLFIWTINDDNNCKNKLFCNNFQCCLAAAAVVGDKFLFVSVSFFFCLFLRGKV